MSQIQSASSHIAAIDQGTSSTRCIIFDFSGSVVSQHNVEHEQIHLQPGWTEHSPPEIWENVVECVEKSLAKAKLREQDIRVIGITNQRESTVVWNRHTGKPYHNIVVWNDTRTEAICNELIENGGTDRFRKRTGLPISTYFSASKLMWLLDTCPDLKKDALSGNALFGTVDTWLVWKLTEGAKHVTDVTNASRTLLMNIETLQWDHKILAELGIPLCMLPEIRSSSEIYGQSVALLKGVPIGGVLGDQQAALFGQTCFEAGSVKCTYGSGSFILMNTGEKIVRSAHSLLSTVGYKIGSEKCVYALEGSIAYAGSTVQWCRDNLGFIRSAGEIESLARTVPDNGGVYFVPAFSGLLAPHWCQSARGVICGLTSFNTKAHVVRAALEAVSFQVNEVIAAMRVDSGVSLKVVKADGGMTVNALVMQFQADIADTVVVVPQVAETTALGAAFAAGLAVGIWKSTEELRATWKVEKLYSPNISADERYALLSNFAKAVKRSMNWEEENPSDDEAPRGTPRRIDSPQNDRAFRRGLETIFPLSLMAVICGVFLLSGSRRFF